MYTHSARSRSSPSVVITEEITLSETVKFIGKLPKSKGSIQFSCLPDYIPAVNSVKDIEVEGYYDTPAHSFALENNVHFLALNDEYNYGNIDGTRKKYTYDLSEPGNYLTSRKTAINCAADINRDGKINVFDKIVLKRIIMK